MENKSKNLCVIGAGAWGGNHVRVFNELGVLRGVCDTSAEHLSKIKEKYRGIKYYSALEEVIKDKSISAVVVATPAATHYEIARQALLAGKDVFVEKPLALSVHEAKELIELANSRRKILMVGHILNYHPAVKKLKEMIDNGELGKVYYIYSNRLNIGKLRSEENILWSFAPHDVSVILRLCNNEKPLCIQAFGGAYIQEKIHDTTLTTLQFPSGINAHIFVSWLNPFKEQKLVVVGSRQMAVFDDTQQNFNDKLVVYPHNISWRSGKIPVAEKAQCIKIEIPDYEEPLLAECKHFIECVKMRKKPLTDGEEGLRVLEVLSLAERSLQNAYTIPTSFESANFTSSRENVYIDKTALIDEGVKIGEGTRIWAFSHILKNSSIGKNCRIGQNVVIGPDVVVGDGCKIQNNVSVYKGVTLEKNVFCGPSMVFTNIINPRSEITRIHDELKTTLVKEGATLGANSTIVCGHSIGRYAFVGAGAVVTKDVPDYALVVGNPARITGWMCRCGVKLKFIGQKGHCPDCGKEYKKISDDKIAEK